MYTDLYLKPKPLYPITSQDENFHLISDTQLFSNLISTADFSRVMSKLQLLKRTKTSLNMVFSIKTHQGCLPVFMHSEYKNNHIHVRLYDLNQMSEAEMKKYYFKKAD